MGVMTILMAVFATACISDPSSPDDDPVDPRDLEYDPDLGVDFDRMEERESGLFVEDLEEGDGAEAEVGDEVLVDYTGSLPDGTVFDSSADRDPLSFTLGEGQVIEGWEEGVRGMKEGGVRLLVIPPHLAYGDAGAGGGVIPPGATLVFEVELVEVL